MAARSLFLLCRLALVAVAATVTPSNTTDASAEDDGIVLLVSHGEGMVPASTVAPLTTVAASGLEVRTLLQTLLTFSHLLSFCLPHSHQDGPASYSLQPTVPPKTLIVQTLPISTVNPLPTREILPPPMC